MARPRSDIAPRIIHAARRRFLLEGVDGASLRRIAKDADTSIGMVYYYFPTKDDLFLAVIEEVYAGLCDDLASALAPEQTAPDRLARMFARFGAMSDDEITVVRMMLRELLVSSSRLDRVVERFSRGHLPLVLATVQEGIGSGELSREHSGSVATIAALTLCIVPQVVRRVVGPSAPEALQVPAGQELAAGLLRLLLDGVRA